MKRIKILTITFISLIMLMGMKEVKAQDVNNINQLDKCLKGTETVCRIKSNMNITKAIEIGRDVELDLNNYEMNYQLNTGPAFNILSNNFTITNGTLRTTGNVLFNIESSGKLIVNGKTTIISDGKPNIISAPNEGTNVYDEDILSNDNVKERLYLEEGYEFCEYTSSNPTGKILKLNYQFKIEYNNEEGEIKNLPQNGKFAEELWIKPKEGYEIDKVILDGNEIDFEKGIRSITTVTDEGEIQTDVEFDIVDLRPYNENQTDLTKNFNLKVSFKKVNDTNNTPSNDEGNNDEKPNNPQTYDGELKNILLVVIGVFTALLSIHSLKKKKS